MMEGIFNEWSDIIELTNCQVTVKDIDSQYFEIKQGGLIVGQGSFDVPEEESKEPQAPVGSHIYPDIPGRYKSTTRLRKLSDKDEVVESKMTSAFKARRAAAVKDAQKPQPSAPEEEEEKDLPPTPVEVKQKNRPCLMKTVEDGQKKFEDFNVGGGVDYRPNIKEFKRDDRGNKTIPETMECLSHIKPPPVKVKVAKRYK